jgi:hypothetical protein
MHRCDYTQLVTEVGPRAFPVIKCVYRKPHTLPRSELVLDWRPLFNLYWMVRYKKLEENGLLLLPNNIQKTFESLISHCRTYFSLESTRDILAEVYYKKLSHEVYTNLFLICS